MSNRAVTPYKERVNKVKDTLRRQGSSLLEKGLAMGYTRNQIYMVTRRENPAEFGITLEIAEKLGLISPETETTGEQA